MEGRPYRLVGFSFGHLVGDLKIGEYVDVVYEIGINEWNGNRELQYRLVDLRKRHDSEIGVNSPASVYHVDY
jgi:single-stranded-DNA-specific exonuclease